MYRHLGIEEYKLWLYDQVAPIHFTLTASIIGELHIDQLQQALIRVQQRHPLLNVRIVSDRSGKPWLVKDSSSIPLRVVKRQSEQQWHQEVERELSHPFDSNQAPLIRMVLVHSRDISELIITCQHSVADGMSTVYLIRDILQIIGISDSQQQVLPERPPYEYLTPNFTPKFQASSKENLAKSQLEFVNNLAYQKPTLPKNSHPRLLSWSLSAEETTALIHRCQQEQTTVHTAICAAFLLAISQENKTDRNNDFKQHSKLKCFSPINIRRFITSNIQEDFGLYLAAITTEHDLKPDLYVWDFARSIKYQLHQRMLPDQIFAHLPQIEDFICTFPSPSSVKDLFWKVNSYDIGVSNLGRLNIPYQYGQLELAAIYGPALTTHYTNDRFVGVATLNNKMFFTLVYSVAEFLPAQIQLLQKKALQLLMQG
ncbi:condensation domain-containing protein [Nostoc sp. C117]|uniref:condensation domain-containing protein n=1 Tax=Nostoc sp. C117 TaxID=3349875 RepID=UPI00370D4E92